MTETFRAIVVASTGLGLALGWLAWRAARLDIRSPDRLVLELRLAQFSALLLVLAAGIYIGSALTHEDTAGTGLEVAIAMGFFVTAGVVTTWEPTQGLTALAMAWGAHALVDLAHIVDLLPASVVPSWYATGCAVYDVVVAAICYLPVLRR